MQTNTKTIKINVNTNIKKLLDENIQVSSAIKGKEGKIVGIDDKGRVLVEGEDGERKLTDFKGIGLFHFANKNGIKVLTSVSEHKSKKISDKLSLLKMFTNTLTESKDPFKTKDIKDIPGVRTIIEGDEFDVEDSDTKKLIDQYKDSDLSDNELQDALGDDLEQLDYDPEQVEKMIDTIMNALRSRKNDTNRKNKSE